VVPGGLERTAEAAQQIVSKPTPAKTALPHETLLQNAHFSPNAHFSHCETCEHELTQHATPIVRDSAALSVPAIAIFKLSMVAEQQEMVAVRAEGDCKPAVLAAAVMQPGEVGNFSLLKALQDSGVGVMDRGGLAMHNSTRGPHHVSTKRLPNALVPHTNPKQREIWTKLPHCLQGDTRVDRGTCRPQAAKAAHPI
jgi:hypothetical protein